MAEAFSLNREYDYIRMEGLSRVTGRPTHEWDLYILEELVDNGLDADEVLWQQDSSQIPWLRIHMEYIPIPRLRGQQLRVRVTNRSPFPVEKIEAIFDTQRYTSNKVFLKGLTRGVLGNALKTLLGIPYVLRNRFADDWQPDLKPLSIRCGTTEYLPQYIIDPRAGTIHLENEKRRSEPVPGTQISIRVDDFVQEIPRTLEDIQTIAHQYRLCNPHVRFDWVVEMGEAPPWEVSYPQQESWRGKFTGLAPIQWYSHTAFKELLGA